MTADTLKSASITNLDALPVVPNTTGEGGPGYARNASDFATPTAGGLASTSSIYKLVRLPTNVKLKTIDVIADAALDSNGSPTLAIDLGVYYSDSTVDGTAQANQGNSVGGNVNQLVANKAFGSASTLKIDGLSAFTLDKRNKPLWSALGLTSDPGGFFDIVLAFHAAAATAAAGGNLGVQVTYVE